MRLISACTALLLSLAAPAWGQGVVYEREGTATEYPPAFNVTQNVTVKGTLIPELNPKLNKDCSFARGSRIIFVRAERTVTQTYQTGLYSVTSDRVWEIFNDKDVNPRQMTIKRDTTVEDVSYLAEGFCQVRIGGEIYDASCFGNGNETGIRQIRELKQETFALLSCSNGGKAWFSGAMLKSSAAFEAFLYNPY